MAEYLPVRMGSRYLFPEPEQPYRQRAEPHTQQDKSGSEYLIQCQAFEEHAAIDLDKVGGGQCVGGQH